MSPEHSATIDIGAPKQKEVIPNNCLQSGVILQAHLAVLTPWFQTGAPGRKGLRRSSKTKPRSSRGLLTETPIN